MTKEEIMREVQYYLDGKFSGCEFYEDDRVVDNLQAISDKAYEDIWELLNNADHEIDYEIEDWNQNYREGARKAYIQNTKDDMRTRDNLESNLF